LGEHAFADLESVMAVSPENHRQSQRLLNDVRYEDGGVVRGDDVLVA